MQKSTTTEEDSDKKKKSVAMQQGINQAYQLQGEALVAWLEISIMLEVKFFSEIIQFGC